MPPDERPESYVSVAIYLRCYPFDRWQMEAHRFALEDYATRLGLPIPALSMDNGFRSKGPLPELERLIEAVEARQYQVVLIPGPWVFSLSSARARIIMQRLTDAGCQVLELPRGGSETAGEQPPWVQAAQADSCLAGNVRWAAGSRPGQYPVPMERPYDARAPRTPLGTGPRL